MEKESQKDCRGLLLSALLIAALVLVYFFVIKKRFPHSPIVKHDFMEASWNTPVLRVNLWIVSHFLLYFVWGFAFPHCNAGIALALGVGWELFEIIISHTTSSASPFHSLTSIRNDSEVVGATVDIGANMAGFFTGRFVRNRLSKKK